MPFDWRVHDGEPLEQRYERRRADLPGILGLDAWSDLIKAFAETEPLQADRETTPAHDRLLSTFRKFLRETGPDDSRNAFDTAASPVPIVFVSHQRSDLAEAERMAYLACMEGIDYWLDIHDPVLILANQIIRPSDARYPFIIAAIIEMALLNSSYLVAVHTLNSLASKWVPYELGRVRDRQLQSANAGGWFHPNLLPRQCGDYVQLCRIARGGENAVTNWLHNWAGGRNALPWPYNVPPALP